MSHRSQIVNKLVEKFKYINGSEQYRSNLYNNFYNKLKFWDEVSDYPSVYLNAGSERRQYLPGDFKWGYLTVTIRIYVSDDEPEAELEKILEDIEYVIDRNGNLEYSTGKFTEDINIVSIDTDEGLLAPIGVGEITLQVMYDLEVTR